MDICLRCALYIDERSEIKMATIYNYKPDFGRTRMMTSDFGRTRMEVSDFNDHILNQKRTMSSNYFPQYNHNSIGKIDFNKIYKNGKFYNPATTHYGNSSNAVVCDKCRKKNLKSCIGFGSEDLCLSCVVDIETNGHNNNEPATFMEVSSFKNIKSNNHESATFMEVSSFKNNVNGSGVDFSELESLQLDEISLFMKNKFNISENNDVVKKTNNYNKINNPLDVIKKFDELIENYYGDNYNQITSKLTKDELFMYHKYVSMNWLTISNRSIYNLKRLCAMKEEIKNSNVEIFFDNTKRITNIKMKNNGIGKYKILSNDGYTMIAELELIE
jgi:hypothetical protein